MAVVPRKQSSSVSIVIAPTGMASVVKNRSEARAQPRNADLVSLSCGADSFGKNLVCMRGTKYSILRMNDELV